MAKVPFSKLQASVNSSDCTLGYCNKAGEEIRYEVKYYLPFAEKIDLVSRIINQSIDDNGFYNPMRVKLYMALEIVYAYTNLSFTEKMKEDPFKLYDILISAGIFKDIVNVICEDDWKEIQENVWSTINNIYNYRNSALGIMENITSDYSNLNFDVASIQEKLADPENMSLLKEVLARLG
jgi:hypothetical protein